MNASDLRMRTLYHFPASPFSRRTRLALVHKGLDCELRDARSHPALAEEAQRLVPQKTLPVFVDGGRALGDSTAITRWLDAAYPGSPRVWPEGADAADVLEITALVDLALNAIVDVGTRYYPLHDHAAWKEVAGEIHGRAQRALDALANRVRVLGRPTISAGGWSAADMWLFTAVAWTEGLPARAAGHKNIAQILSLGGWKIPGPLSAWAAGHRERADVKSLG